MQMHTHRVRAFALAAGLLLLVFSGWASADPPSRVARLGYTGGAVSFSPAGETDWVRATVNRPLTNGDRLWTDAAARAEIQVGGASIRVSGSTSLAVLNLDDRIVQLQMTQGTMNLRVRRLGPNQVFEVDTPNLAFTVRQSGDYRIVVDPGENATDIIVRSGRAQVYGEGAAYTVDAKQPYRFYGTGLRDYQVVARPVPDRFDQWASERDRRLDRSPSTRFVSPDVVGYQDLDAHGTWRRDRTYGNVWVPSRVAAGWTPYRDGHWSWIDPWGWTWVDDAPWGYAVSHYGRWTNMAGTWGWVPGSARTSAVYAPALVAFIGGNNFKLSNSSGNVGGVGWFPLAPREAYQPAYQVSRGYIDNVNRGHTTVNNTVVNNTVVNNTYNSTNVTQVVYANRQVPGAVVVVPATVFAQSQPVARAAVQVAPQSVASAVVAAVAAVAPTAISVRGAAVVGDKPPARVFDRPVVAHAAPPAARVGFVAQQQQLAANPGQPLVDAARKALVAAASAAAPASVVTVVAPVAAAPGAVLPAPAASVARPGIASARTEGAQAATAPSSAAVAAVPPASAAATVAAPVQNVPRPAVVASAPAQAGRPGVQPEPAAVVPARGQPVASAPRPAQAAAPPAARSSQSAAPAPAVADQPPKPALAKPAAVPAVAAPASTAAVAQPVAPARAPVKSAAMPAVAAPASTAAPAAQPVAPARVPAGAVSSARSEPVPAPRPAATSPSVAAPKPAPPPSAAAGSGGTAPQMPATAPTRQAVPERVVPPVASQAPLVVPPTPPAAPPPVVVRPTPLPAPAARPEAVPASPPAGPQGPVAAPRQQPGPPESAASRAERRDQRPPRAAASAPGGPRSQPEERRRDEDNRKPKE